MELDPGVIKAKLDERGWELADLAAAAYVSIPTAHRVATGKRVSAVTLNKVIMAFALNEPKPAVTELLKRRAS